MLDNNATRNNTFRAYHVTAGGVDTLPVTSRVGMIHRDSRGSVNYEIGIGQMIFSPDGRKLAVMVYHLNQAEIYDFDAATGKVSNPVLLYKPNYQDSRLWLTPDAMDEAYGVAFSPDGSKLYTCFGRGIVFQYDLSNPTPAAMLASRTVVADFPRRHDESLGGATRTRRQNLHSAYHPAYGWLLGVGLLPGRNRTA
jgi:DNA-binding beta-propeller fold protein YncE